MVAVVNLVMSLSAHVCVPIRYGDRSGEELVTCFEYLLLSA